MSDQTPRRLEGKRLWPAAALLLAALAVGSLLSSWTVAQADHEMRANLLQQARLVVQAVPLVSLQALSGTAADLDSPSYQQLKKQLAASRSANPRCRFLYLVGRKADGAVYFFVDSEPADSKDYSSPGQVYEEVPAGFVAVFDTRAEAVEGPVPDRWGEWVSALVPIADPTSGAVVAVLGMDIDATASSTAAGAPPSLSRVTAPVRVWTPSMR